MTSRVSVVIPVHDGARFIADAIASIRAQQTPPDEIVVVDDASTDGSGEVAAGCGTDITVVRHERNGGLPVARNTGVAATTGEVVTFLDADDLWTPKKLAVQTALLRELPDVGIVVGHTQKLRLVHETAGDGADRFEPAGPAELLLSMGATAIRRELYDRVGRYDETLAFTCDWDWFMRARELGVTVRTHPELVQLYRRHGGNLTEDAETGDRETLAMLRKSLGRRRRDAESGRAGTLPGLDHG